MGVTGHFFDALIASKAEQTWRDVYGQAFIGQSRAKTGAKAADEYRRGRCTTYLVVPFTSNVKGLPIHVLSRQLSAYECKGPLVDLIRFHMVEFFVAPLDYNWTMVYTHEDYSLGGPYFHRREWINADELSDGPESPILPL